MPRQEHAHKRPDGGANTQTHPRDVTIYPEAEVNAPRTELVPRVVFRGPVFVPGVRDHLVLGPIGSRNDYVTCTWNPAPWITTGCFSGTLDDFERELQDIQFGARRDEYIGMVAFLRIVCRSRAAPAQQVPAPEEEAPPIAY